MTIQPAFGTKDLNPSINGGGIDKLEKARINVFQNILEKECYELNKGFFKWVENFFNKSSEFFVGMA